MCDLHENTFDHDTPVGAISGQIRHALEDLNPSRWIKLYNSGNFFDRQSIPPDEYADIASLCSDFERIIVENHPRIGASLHQQFSDRIDARLEVAVGLETVQPRWLDRIGKQMSRDQFDQYAKQLDAMGVDLRVFLIVGMPDNSIVEAMRWARLSVRHAVAAGARHVSLIPSRMGNGWNRMGHRLPTLNQRHMADLFSDSLQDLKGDACLSVDLWGFEADDAEAKQELKRFENAILHQDDEWL